MNQLQKTNTDVISKLVLDGDISQMTKEQRVTYYQQFCNSLGLNPLTQPFQIIKFQGKERLYATKDCTEQLRKIHGVSITEITSNKIEDVYIVTAKAQDRFGKIDTSTGAVTITNLKGDALANALMKAETKAKRRVTLSICGLGILDESETETIKDAITEDIQSEVVVKKKLNDEQFARLKEAVKLNRDINGTPALDWAINNCDLTETQLHELTN